MRRNEAQLQRQNPVKASNGSYLRSPFDISQKFADLAARQVEQGGTRRHLLSSANRTEEDRDGLEKSNTDMRPWSRAGVGASHLSVKEKNMQRTQAEQIYGDDDHLYSKSSHATVVDEATADAEKAKAKKKKKKGDSAAKHGAAEAEDRELDGDHATTTASGSTTTASSASANGMKRQFAVDMRDSEAMQKMVPSHVRKQRRAQALGTHRGAVAKHDGQSGDDEEADVAEASLRPQLSGRQSAAAVAPPARFIVPRPITSNARPVPVETAEGEAGQDSDDDGVLEEVPVGVGHKRGREEAPSAPARASLGAPKNRLQQLQAMRDSALSGGRKRR